MTASVLIIYGSTRIPEPTFKGKVADLLPPAPLGWQIKQRAIAETPEIQQAVGELLNYDDGVFVDYISNNARLSVYIAYWKPGKMSHRLVAGHSPDVCWVGGGWKKEFAGTVTDFSRYDLTLYPAQSRLFSINGQQEYVWFWHTVGSDVKLYESVTSPPWHAIIADILEKGLDQREEQFFIRISSSHPLDSALLKPVLYPFLRSLPFNP